MPLLTKTKKFIPIFLLLLIELLLFLSNYSSGTYLLGWDNLFPEFNFSENIKRSFFAIWQEYRGLGLLDGMSFAANLPHYIFLSVISFFLSQNFSRYFFIFLMHFIGGLSCYFLLEELLNNLPYKKFISLIGSLFYLLNIATVQMFFAPYEVFTVHFAFLPILLLFVIRYLKNHNKTDLILFVVFSLLSIPQSHVPTLFLVYFAALFSVLGTHLWFFKKKALKSVFIVVLLTFLINSYWGLPYIYSAFNNAKTVTDSKINQMSTEDIQLNNKAYGDFKEVVFLEGFFLDYIDVQNKEGNLYMMENWKNHIQTPLFVLTALFFFSLSIIGFIRMIIERRTNLLSFGGLFIFSFLMLGNEIPLVKAFPELLENYVPYFSQAFRFIFTKFSILFALSYSIFIGVGFSFVLNKLSKLKNLIPIFLIFPIFLLVFYSYPAFQGNFLYKNLKTKIPTEYFNVVHFLMNKNNNRRIAILSQPTYWGWTYTGWGYRGSGFIWYGIPQATLDGAFYPWSDKNENYYWEISYALYSKNQELFEKVLEKYQINWLLVDGNVINPSSPKALYFDELEEMISKSNKISLAQEFGKIKIFEVNLETPVKDFVFLAENLPAIGPNYKWNNYDQAYLENGNYFSNQQSAISNQLIFYPFRSLSTDRSQADLEFQVEDRGEYFVFKKSIPESLKNYQLIIPKETRELVWVDPQDLSKIRFLKPEVAIKESMIEVKVPKVGGYYGAEIESANEPTIQKAVNCQEYLGGQVTNEIVEENGKKFLRLSAVDAKNCGTAFWLPNLNHGLAYLITVESRNLKGKSLLFWLENLNSRKADLETHLPKLENGNSKFETSFFVQPPMEEDGLGYTLHFDNLSIGKVESVNELGKITVNPIPFKFLSSLKLVNPQAVVVEPQLYEPVEVYHPNPSYYQIQPSIINHQPSTILVLSQAYHDGWLAWEGKPFLGKRLQHIEVNNWQNGWILPNNLAINQSSNLTISIFFWPQLLEYFGFILLGVTLFGVGIYSLRKKSIT